MNATTAVILAVLLALPGHRPPEPQRSCIARHRDSIAAVADQGRELGVPPAVLLAVARRETHLGCDPGEGGGWGAPIDRRHRHTAGTPLQAAQALARSFGECGTWTGAVSRFRSGRCVIPNAPAPTGTNEPPPPDPWRDHRNYVRGIIRDVRDIHRRTREPLPAAL